jgi:hypothetical protein
LKTGDRLKDKGRAAPQGKGSTMRLAQVGVHSPETLGLAGVVAGLLFFVAGYVVGAQSQRADSLAAASAGAAGRCPPSALGPRSEFEPLASDGRERKVKTIVIPTN